MEGAAKLFRKENPGVKVVIGGGGSGSGVKNAGLGKIDIGMASRGLKDKEKSTYPDLNPVPIGMDGVAVIVNKANPIKAITKDQLFQIFTGQIDNWKAAGGNDAAIDVVGILLKHGTAEVFMKYVGIEGEEEGEGAKKVIRYMKKEGAAKGTIAAQGADGNRPACAAVITKPNAIGFASIGVAESLAAKGAKIKMLTLDGVEPTVEKVVSGEYALARPLLVITKGAPSRMAEKIH